MPEASEGDFIYVHFFTLSTVDVYVNIRRAVDEGSNDISCQVNQGDTILFQHPNKMYLSFLSSGSESKFYLNIFYSPQLTGATYDNFMRCSDNGASLSLNRVTNDKGT